MTQPEGGTTGSGEPQEDGLPTGMPSRHEESPILRYMREKYGIEFTGVVSPDASGRLPVTNPDITHGDGEERFISLRRPGMDGDLDDMAETYDIGTLDSKILHNRIDDKPWQDPRYMPSMLPETGLGKIVPSKIFNRDEHNIETPKPGERKPLFEKFNNETLIDVGDLPLPKKPVLSPDELEGLRQAFRATHAYGEGLGIIGERPRDPEERRPLLPGVELDLTQTGDKPVDDSNAVVPRLYITFHTEQEPIATQLGNDDSDPEPPLYQFPEKY